jgi:hypothetical protein
LGQRYAYPKQIFKAPTLPGVVLLFVDDQLLEVWAGGSIREELAGKSQLSCDPWNSATQFGYEVILAPEQRAARASELARLLRTDRA